MQSRTPNAVERAYLELAFQIPCLACALFHDANDTPAEYHHTRGKTEPNAHLAGFSLCSRHHRIADPQKRWISRHGDGKTAFEKRYMSEADFLTEQRSQILELTERCINGV